MLHIFYIVYHEKRTYFLSLTLMNAHLPTFDKPDDCILYSYLERKKKKGQGQVIVSLHHQIQLLSIQSILSDVNLMPYVSHGTSSDSYLHT